MGLDRQRRLMTRMAATQAVLEAIGASLTSLVPQGQLGLCFGAARGYERDEAKSGLRIRPFRCAHNELTARSSFSVRECHDRIPGEE
jgi:hypothetical protein